MNTGFARSTGKRVGASLKASFVLPLLFLGVGGRAPIVMAQSAGTFTATGNMTTPRLGHTATLASLMAQSAGTFTATGNMTTPRFLHTATLLQDGRVLIAGGGFNSGIASAELYDPATGTFTATGNMTTPRAQHTATLLPNGKVLIAGGDSAELYDPSTGSFTATGNMTTAPWGCTACLDHKAILLPNGKVLIVAFEGAELYDPSTGTFAPTGNMINPYYTARTATLLTSGKVLVAGGTNDFGDSAGAELYDPSTGTFTPTGNMTTGRESHTATLLPDGTVLITGSQRGAFGGGYGLASAEIYDPAIGTFSATGNMTTPRLLQTATLLADGTVLVTGGSPGAGGLLASAEIYHPAAVQGAPKVQIVDNNTGSRTTLAVGDSFSFQVAGAPPISLVSVSEAGWSGSVGYTDASGLFWLNGIVGSNVIGTWQQTWTIGGVLAQPGPLQFTIIPKP